MNLTPSYRPSYPKPAYFETPLAVLFVLTLFAAGLYAVTQRPTYAPQPVAGPRLELALSGVLTSQLSLTKEDFASVRCTPAGFYLKSVSGYAPMGLELRFQGPGTGTQNATYLLGAGVGPLTLRTVTDESAPGSVFGSRDGSVTRTAAKTGDTFTFTASLTDAYGQPLLVSGRLECPARPG